MGLGAINEIVVIIPDLVEQLAAFTPEQIRSSISLQLTNARLKQANKLVPKTSAIASSFTRDVVAGTRIDLSMFEEEPAAAAAAAAEEVEQFAAAGGGGGSAAPARPPTEKKSYFRQYPELSKLRIRDRVAIVAEELGIDIELNSPEYAAAKLAFDERYKQDQNLATAIASRAEEEPRMGKKRYAVYVESVRADVKPLAELYAKHLKTQKQKVAFREMLAANRAAVAAAAEEEEEEED